MMVRVHIAGFGSPMITNLEHPLKVGGTFYIKGIDGVRYRATEIELDPRKDEFDAVIHAEADA